MWKARVGGENYMVEERGRIMHGNLVPECAVMGKKILVDIHTGVYI